ncbi:unnamed protein product [Hermetia illucens]|uniref:Uncharacterized protein n=1 Tax=Hermetia illucens TaxID=343691 RepID=A0A7R8YYX0_HERIL|nr:unnamed protein product [Hermetia illucens]
MLQIKFNLIFFAFVLLVLVQFKTGQSIDSPFSRNSNLAANPENIRQTANEALELLSNITDLVINKVRNGVQQLTQKMSNSTG